MDKILNFIKKKKVDKKFKEAGHGYSLGNNTPQTSSRPHHQTSPVKQQQSGPTRPDAELLAQAAEKRMAQSKPAQSSLTPMQKYIREQARKQLEEEQRNKLAQLHVDQQQNNEAANDDTRTGKANSTVRYTCELFGDDEESAVPKSEMMGKLEDLLFAMLEDDESDAGTAIFIIYTLNKEHVREPAIETMHKYLQNIVTNPQEAKFRRIRMSNRVFQDKIIPCKGAIEFLKALGFAVQEEQSEGGKEDFLVMPNSPNMDTIKERQKLLAEGRSISIRVFRDRKVFQIDPNRALPQPEIPDDFFTWTAEELKKEQERRAEAMEKMSMLRTSKMREMDAARDKMPTHKYTYIRVRFPNNYILQGIFNVFEKLQSVREFVSKNLAIDHGTFNFNGGLEDESTLLSLGLTPAALLHFHWDDMTMSHFHHDGLEDVPYLMKQLEQNAQPLYQ